ncbi:MAG: FAD-dependent oxidoreductase, partial [candidate division KSB1 bacterium]
LGTWYPMGGMYKIIEAMTAVAKAQGVEFVTGAAVNEIEVREGAAQGVRCNGHYFEADVVVGGADYHHVEQELLAPEYRTYDQRYWDTRVMAPSSLIFYLGINKRLDNLQHHNLFFDEDLDAHASEIYETPRWPSRPLFYVCCPSKTDASVAPPGCENLFILMPVASGLPDSEEVRERYFELIITRLERLTGQRMQSSIVFKRSYCIDDFRTDYNAYKGNAYGLANTLRQTALFKPAIRSRKVKNLFFTGQLTVPGPGMPPSLISGQVAANEILKTLEQ